MGLEGVVHERGCQSGLQKVDEKLVDVKRNLVNSVGTVYHLELLGCLFDLVLLHMFIVAAVVIKLERLLQLAGK
jgi:hypothetical protein